MIQAKYIDRAKSAAGIESVFSDLYPGITLKKAGKDLVCCCPFHNEKTPSFHLNLAKGTWRCFGTCAEGGDQIALVMKAKTMDFNEAAKWLIKNYLSEVDINSIEKKSTPEEIELEKKKETMYTYNQYAMHWFVEQLWNNNPGAMAARDYAIMKDEVKIQKGKGKKAKILESHGRWPEDAVRQGDFGYAPKDGSLFVKWAATKGLREDILEEIGLIKRGERTGEYYCFFRERLVIPQKNRWGKVEAFTCRDLSEQSQSAKYLNNQESAIYKKNETLFGLDNAWKRAHEVSTLYIVEGAVDAIRLHSIGLLNAVAPLGGGLGKEQLEILNWANKPKLVFIPDCDAPTEKDKIIDGKKMPAGTAFAVKAAKLATSMGFDVSIRLIPSEEADGHNTDPDSYITSMNVFNSMKEKGFIEWYASLIYDPQAAAGDKLQQINYVCDVLATVKDETKRKFYLSIITEIYKNAIQWKNALNDAMKRLQENRRRVEQMKNDEGYSEYGFYRKKNHYYSVASDSKEYDWSNFVIKPLFHIEDDVSPKRLFEIENEQGKKRIIELKQTEITTLTQFKPKVEGYGSYMFYAKQEQFDKLKAWLYDHTDSAFEVKQMGWQNEGEEGFFAFCNGIVLHGEWKPVDDYGIVHIGNENYYLPTESKIYKNSRELFQNERKFRHDPQMNIDISDYLERICRVFGNNGKVAICFYFATLFRDIIKNRTRFFPLLNIYGKKGTGKTELAVTLTSFFMNESETTNIESTTIPAMADKVSAFSNAIVHLDEYKNSIHQTKVDFLKGIWDSAGRTRMNMDRDKKRESTAVDCGVVITGQEIPTVDIALFSRMIYLESQKSEHTPQEKEEYQELMKLRKMGATAATVEILKYRDNVESSWNQAWTDASQKINDALKNEGCMDRIINNWTVLLAAVYALERHISFKMPFTADEVYELCLEGIRRQDSMSQTTDELAIFWEMFMNARAAGELIEGQDYKIETASQISLRGNKGKTGSRNFECVKQLLLVRKRPALSKTSIQARKENVNMIPPESLIGYLEHTPEYYGVTGSMRKWKVYDKQGNIDKMSRDGQTLQISIDEDRAMVFDYTMLQNKYDIELHRSNEYVSDAHEELVDEERRNS